MEVGLGIGQVLTFGLIMSFVEGRGMSMLVVFSCKNVKCKIKIFYVPCVAYKSYS